MPENPVCLILLGFERAIVSNIPGTTRDAIEKTVHWDGLEISFLDTAGARAQTDDVIEARGIRLGLNLAKEVDLCLLVFSAQRENTQEQLDWLEEQVSPVPVIRVGTHLDQCTSHAGDVLISNTTKENIDVLKEKILSSLREKPRKVLLFLSSHSDSMIYSCHWRAIAQWQVKLFWVSMVQPLLPKRLQKH